MRHMHRIAVFVFSVLLSAGASASVLATNTTYGVIDGREDSRALRVNTYGIITDLNITVEFSKCDDPPIGRVGTRCLGSGDPFEEEFVLTLIAPNGDQVDLVDPFGTYTGVATRGAGRVSVSFDDEAANAAGPRIQAGSFRPAQALSAFDGMNTFGSWTLYLQDFAPGDPLEFFSAQLDITYVPEPATLAMLGLGLIGLRVARKRRVDRGAWVTATRSASRPRR
jgi:hypothetical protein